MSPIVTRPRYGRALLLCVALGATACAPRHAAVPAPVLDVRRTPPNALADEVLRRTNARRRALGLPALLRSETLMVAAQLQAEQMAVAERLDHELRGSPFPTLTSRLTAVAYDMRAAGENIGVGYHDAAAVVEGWMTSPGHRENIVSPRYSEIGTGAAQSRTGRLYYAQVFGQPLRPTTATASR